MAKNKNEVELLLSLKDEMSKGFKRIDAAQKKALGGVDKNSKKAKSSLSSLGKALPIAGFLTFAGGIALITKGLGSVISTTKEFEQSMANLKAISKPTESGFISLSKAARDLGATTVFTAQESAEAFTELAKLGFKTNEIIASSAAVLALAAGTGEDMASSAETMASTLAQFNLKASESGRVADVMAKSFTDSALNLERFREAMKFAGPAAAASNIDLETTTSLLEILSKNAITGTVAGNGLKRVFIDMQTSTSKLSRYLTALGVDATATVSEKFQALNEAGLTFGEVAQLVGKVSATSTSILIKNADSIDKVKESLDRASGSAQKMADVRLDTLDGDLKLLKSSLSELAIQTGEHTNPAIRDMTQGLTDMVVGSNEAETAVEGIGSVIKDVGSLFAKSTLDLLLWRKVIDPEADVEAIDLANIDTKLEGVKALTEQEKRRLAILRKINGITPKKVQKSVKVSDVIGSDDKTRKDDFAAKRLAEEIRAAQERDPDRKLKPVSNISGIWTEMNQAQIDAEKSQLEALSILNSEHGLSELERLKLRKDKELELITDNAELKAAIELKYANQIAAEKQEIAEKEKIQNQLMQNSYLDMTNSIIDAGEAGLKASKADANAQKAIAIGQIQMNAAVGMVKVWADPGYPAAIPLTIAIGAQSTAASAVVASQSFASGGIVQPEFGKPAQGDKIMIAANPGEEVLKADDPKNSNNNVNSNNNQPLVIQLEIGGQQFAQAVVDINNRNDRTGRSKRRGM